MTDQPSGGPIESPFTDGAVDPSPQSVQDGPGSQAPGPVCIESIVVPLMKGIETAADRHDAAIAQAVLTPEQQLELTRGILEGYRAENLALHAELEKAVIERNILRAITAPDESKRRYYPTTKARTNTESLFDDLIMLAACMWGAILLSEFVSELVSRE